MVRESAKPRTPDSGALSADTADFLTRRAARLLARLRERSPVVMQVLALAGGLTWLGRLILICACALGLSLAALDGSRRINILAFPLIGLLAWIHLGAIFVVLGAETNVVRTRKLWPRSLLGPPDAGT